MTTRDKKGIGNRVTSHVWGIFNKQRTRDSFAFVVNVTISKRRNAFV